ncbi:MAG: 2-C-methyl-D-erythritol 2,4-cyclodiphosphate synthase [Gammaproteobacteria bacterium]|jgi:2-C-methyl-D-erythritol 2,4-cyclodiphosphate synthase|nr:2-C-methyl-D-erythritol 2,4-cyclodiphosphate synthase [Gammaproteobacteria bacterium]MBT3721859.1 2-C-methyl-D-erythritol 2,4-cyclodiphosphate synthase [Gammaproteobacteria bacterium]MBT4077871.1 2-C-methyl-D-erythritol 2,4-cyclodiphosphate synthase [Gammaproteobacteria bacterium]MBT4194961.1 2-C-methyl-D-erythritol 2,4-cyclodiphosphate synthase [Gammaproteobacteria bacterium]MBT4448464.1 2-C-methyl-D-erythritol 2,4-cyclodiphosphate synthase [Gammaproteobacteria bacterium]
MIRVGHGFDVHAFCDGESIILGGVKIPYDKAFKAHSDGDVLIHALCDALLGAAGLGDIGLHFPDTDVQFKNTDSRVFLRKVNEMVSDQGLILGNADITIIAQAPKMAPHLSSMKKSLSETLECDPLQLNIKATTTEYLGYCGRQEGIAVHAVVLLEGEL